MLPIRRATLTMTGDLGKVAGAVITDLYGEIWYFADPSQRPFWAFTCRISNPYLWSISMLFERQKVEQLARLARLGLDDAVLARTTQSLGDVLTLIDQLQALDTAGVEPMSHPLDAVQRLRADVVSEPNQRDALQAIAPAVADDLFLVPKVIE